MKRQKRTACRWRTRSKALLIERLQWSKVWQNKARTTYGKARWAEEKDLVEAGYAKDWAEWQGQITSTWTMDRWQKNRST